MFFTLCSKVRPLEGFKKYRHIDTLAFFYEVTLASTKRLDKDGEGKNGEREEHWIITVEVQTVKAERGLHTFDYYVN